jgi:hypothetical protein
MTTSGQIVREAPPSVEPEPRTDDANRSRPTPPFTVVVKRRVLGASSRLGILRGIRDSAWRQRRLLILCYHSISIDDEHEWSGTYSMAPAVLESRLRMLRDGRYNVLPLDEACAGLYEGTLPPRSVALTFDDGMFDFHARAWPLLQRFGFPATVYLTTYYSDYGKADLRTAVLLRAVARADAHAAGRMCRPCSGPRCRGSSRTPRGERVRTATSRVRRSRAAHPARADGLRGATDHSPRRRLRRDSGEAAPHRDDARRGRGGRARRASTWSCTRTGIARRTTTRCSCARSPTTASGSA